MMQGTICRLTQTKSRGFGFISGEDGSEYFFHVNECSPREGFMAMVEGQRVDFNIDRNHAKGTRAVNVVLLK